MVLTGSQGLDNIIHLNAFNIHEATSSSGAEMLHTGEHGQSSIYLCVLGVWLTAWHMVGTQ